jgi:hypothetical protein
MPGNRVYGIYRVYIYAAIYLPMQIHLLRKEEAAHPVQILFSPKKDFSVYFVRFALFPALIKK